MATSVEESKPNVCRYYRAQGGCWFGKKCRYLHEGEEPQGITIRDPKVCRYFQSATGCRNGNTCKFVHANDSGSDGEKCLSSSPTDESVDTSTESISDVSHGDIKPSDVSLSDPTLSDVDQSEATPPDIGSDSSQSDDAVGQEASGETDLTKDQNDNKHRVSEWKPKEIYTCGECKQVYKGKDAYDEILRHHTEMLCKMEKVHLAFLTTNQWFKQIVACGACGKDFARSRDLLRHLVDKSKFIKQKKDRELHTSLLEEVARAFTDRDVGLTTESESQEELLIYLTNHVGPDPATDSDSSDVGLGMGLYMLSQVPRMQRMSSADYEDELEERMANFGFSNDEVEELMCQGIMPWDDCAYDALNVLNGEYDDY